MEDEEKGEGLSRRRESHALQVASAGHVFDLSETPSTGCGCTDDGCRGYGTGYGTGYNRSSCSVAHVPSAFRMCFPQRFMGSHAAGLSPAAASASSSAADAAAVSAPVTAQGGQERQKEMGWRDDAPSGRVEGVSVRLGEAELLGVTGKTGSGKSLLLLGILGEVPLSSGAMHRSVPSLAYASQQPLLIEGTVRDNILFGTPLDEALYTKVLDACALHSDLALWPCGDASLVEEGGGNLSGGQRTRVSLARAAYAALHCKMTAESAYATLHRCSATPQLHADNNGGCDNRHSNSRDNRSNNSSSCSSRGAPPPVLVLLDDPLAALDPAIASHVFQQCVCGLLAGLPRIVVTHHVQYLGSCDRVLLLDDDTAAACGAWSDLCALPSAQQHWGNHPPGPDFSDVSDDSGTCSDSAVCATDSDSEFDSCSSTDTDEDGTLAGTQSCRCKNGTTAAYVSSSSSRSSSSSVCSVDCDRSSDSDTDAPTDSTDDCPLIGSKVVVEKAEVARGRGVDACRERECVSHGGQLAEGLICESGEAAAAAASAAAELRGGEEGVLEASGSTEGDEQGLLDVEGWQHGAIPMSVFWGYARQMGVLPLLLIAALFLAAHVSNCLASWFLGVWTDTPHTIHHPLLTLTAIALSCVALSLLASLLFHRAALRASSCLHSRMLASVLASPLAFFHRNPTGRVLNRFSEDLGVTDDVLPEMLLGLVNSVGLCIAAVVSACIAVPWTLIPVLPLLLLLLQLRHLYVCTAREVRRMECTTRSVLLSRFLASMEGLPTIRAFSQQRRFHRLFLRHVTANATPHLFWLATWEWLGFQLDLLVAAALLSAALAAVALRHSLPPAMAALALSYLLQLPDSLRWALQYGAELENTFTSVERTLEYTTIPSEVPPPSPNSQSKRQQQQQPWQQQQVKQQQQQQHQQQKQQEQQKQQQQEKSTAKSTIFSMLYRALRTAISLLPPKSLCAHIPLLPNCQATNAASHSEEEGNSRSSLRPPWPSAGAVRVEQLTVRYGSTGQAVLRSLSFRLAGGEKCGVVGRTGAGKSTLMLALLRLVEASSGSICIDGVDIASLPLATLRSEVVAIPQEPVLFSQSLRFNLDPLGQHSDEALWSVLATVRLKPLVAGLLGGLDGALAQGGGNLSLGQRQLLCLARALLASTRVLLMDEATASMDGESDAVIKDILWESFKDSTVITIAHRLSTVLHYDQVLVMERGQSIEFGAPENLRKLKSSAFFSMLADNTSKID